MARILGALVMALVLLVPVPASAAECRGVPVLLVHDFAATEATMQPLARRLREDGRCVQTRTYGRYPGPALLGGLQSLEYTATELAAWIAEIGGPVDVVAHGAGSLAVTRALRDAYDVGHPLPVRTVIALGGLWGGTDLAFLGRFDLLSRAAGTYPTVLAVERLLLDRTCAVCREVIAHSDFLTELAADGVLVPGVRQVNLVTRYDELVAPYRSGLHDGMVDVVLPPGVLVEHLGLPSSPRAGRQILAMLTP